LRRDLGRVGRGVFPPAQVAEVKALACELPAEQGVPLSRWSSAELSAMVVAAAPVAGVDVPRLLGAAVLAAAPVAGVDVPRLLGATVVVVLAARGVAAGAVRAPAVDLPEAAGRERGLVLPICNE
jgi:hypothetical protein